MTIDDAIRELEELRRIYGGNVPLMVSEALVDEDELKPCEYRLQEVTGFDMHAHCYPLAGAPRHVLIELD